MTFLEAAIELLKREGKPLNYKRLAELAVKHNLLSVVGRDPEGTMESRLADAMAHPSAQAPLVLVKDGVYGLRTYPPQPYPVPQPGAAAPLPSAAAEARSAEADAQPAAQASAEGAAERKSPPRRERSRRDQGAPSDAAASAEAEPGAAPSPDEGEAEEGGEGARPRRRRRGGRSRRRRGEGEAGAEATVEESEGGAPRGEPIAASTGAGGPERGRQEAGEAMEELRSSPDALVVGAGVEAPMVERPQEGPEEPAEGALEALDEGAEEDLESLLPDEYEVVSGPTMAPSYGAEELIRDEEGRPVRAEIPGRRSEERGRRRRERERPRSKAPREAETPRRAAPERPPAPSPAPAPTREGEPRDRGVLPAALEILRSSEGRPMHVRQLADLVMKRRLLDSNGAVTQDLPRALRVALSCEQRDRDREGLRPRVRGLGAGQYVAADRKLEPELLSAEREVLERAQRLRDATRTALRRRVGRMSPAAFEVLARTLADKLGITRLELVRRGEGVAYYGGQRAAGVGLVRTLVAVRPGEAELGRRAVGELRAGLQARGFDEGLLFAAGRAGADALTELRAGTGVTVYDGQELAALLIRHGLGVRRMLMPVDHLDLEFFSELTEG